MIFFSILAWKHWSSEIEMEVKQVFKASISLNINTQQPCIHFCLIRCIIKQPFPPIHVPKSHPPSPQSTKYGPLHMYINKQLVMYFCRLKKIVLCSREFKEITENHSSRVENISGWRTKHISSYIHYLVTMAVDSGMI